MRSFSLILEKLVIFSSLFTFPLESPVFIGFLGGEECFWLFTHSSPLFTFSVHHICFLVKKYIFVLSMYCQGQTAY